MSDGRSSASAVARRQRGRPDRLTPEVLRLYLEGYVLGLPEAECAPFAQVGEVTARRWKAKAREAVKRDPSTWSSLDRRCVELWSALLHARAQRIGQHTGWLRDACMRGETVTTYRKDGSVESVRSKPPEYRANAWWLQHMERVAEVDRVALEHEHTHRMALPEGLTPEDLLARNVKAAVAVLGLPRVLELAHQAGGVISVPAIVIDSAELPTGGDRNGRQQGGKP